MQFKAKRRYQEMYGDNYGEDVAIEEDLEQEVLSYFLFLNKLSVSGRAE